MAHSRVKLTYQCPVKYNALEPVSKGKFCSMCQKEVLDYSSTGLQELNQLSKTQFGHGHCGSFRAYQLDQPFRNRKDRLIAYYQRLQLSTTRFRFGKRVLLLAVIIGLFLSGCTRRLTGWTSDDWFISEDAKDTEHRK